MIATRHGRTALMLGGIVAGMVGLAYASVPLYKLFCQVTGFAGTPLRGDQPSTVTTERAITVRFDANVQSQLPWRFEPIDRAVTINVGENGLIGYRAKNISSQPLVGTATFNVTPAKAAPYFVKIQCFCFSEQRLEPSESVEMPVAFYVDPAMLDDPGLRDVKTITLSYTFFRAAEQRTSALATPRPAAN